MSDKNARNGEDMPEVLADDIKGYELLSAKETENVLREIESRHSDLAIEIKSEETSNSTLTLFSIYTHFNTWQKKKKL